jgi:hypothetical protein
VREQFGGDGTGLDAAHPHAVRGEFLPEGLGERGDAELGRVVNCAAPARDPARHRPDVDQVGDAARPGGGRRPQVRDRLLGHVQQPVQVELQHAAPVIVPAGVERAEQHDAGVVDQDVEPAELIGHPADGGPGLRAGGFGHRDQALPGLREDSVGVAADPVTDPRQQVDDVLGGDVGERDRDVAGPDEFVEIQCGFCLGCGVAVRRLIYAVGHPAAHHEGHAGQGGPRFHAHQRSSRAAPRRHRADNLTEFE